MSAVCRRRGLLALATAIALVACTEAPETAQPIEVLRRAPLQLGVEAQGELKAATATKLSVPGQGWSSRQLVWMVPLRCWQPLGACSSCGTWCSATAHLQQRSPAAAQP